MRCGTMDLRGPFALEDQVQRKVNQEFVIPYGSGRDSHLSAHSPPCEVDPVQSMYRMTAESVVVS